MRGDVQSGNSGGPVVDETGVSSRRCSRSAPGRQRAATASRTRRSRRRSRTRAAARDRLRRALGRQPSRSSAAERLLERRDDVDPVDRSRDASTSARASSRPTAGASRRRRRCSVVEHGVRDADAGHLVVKPQRHPVARSGQTPSSTGMGHVPPSRSTKRSRQLEIEERLRHREPGAGLDLALEALELELEVVCGRVDCDADEERGRRVDRPAVVVLAEVQWRDELHEADRVDLVDASRAWVVAHVRRVARDREDVAHTSACAPSSKPSSPITDVSRGVTWGIVSIPHSRSIVADGHQRVHPRARHRVVVDVDEADSPESLSALRDLERARRCVPPFGGSSSTLTTHSPSRSARARPVSSCLRRRASGSDGSSLSKTPRRRTRAVLDRVADRRDLRRRRAAATADDPGAERHGLRGELAEVVGGRVRVDDAAAGEAREADVRQGGERGARASRICASAPRARRGPAPWFVPIAATSRSRAGRAAAARRPRRATSASSSNVSSATIGSDETLRTASTATTSSSRSKNVSTMNRSTPRPSSTLRLLGEQRAVRGPRRTPPARRAGRSSRR